MVIGDEIKRKIKETPDGVVLAVKDFDVEMRYQGALVKALNRLVEQGMLQRLSKGRYYKPRKTVFGVLRPVPEEVTKDLLERNGKPIGYVTGNSAFSMMGLTTQITSSIVIGTNRYRRPITRGEYDISFLLQRNPITKENIPLLRILDAIRMIREIPASSPDEVVERLGSVISALVREEQMRLIDLAENYTPYVRALLGAIMEVNNLDAEMLKEGLSGTTYYRMPISKEALPSKKNWNVL